MPSPARSEMPSWRPDHLWRSSNDVVAAPPPARVASGATCLVEMIGPPGVGKTTVALAVAEAFARVEIKVHMALSPRAGEAPGVALQTRVGKLAAALASVAWREPVADELLRLMPLSSPLAALRRRRYLAGLAAPQPEGVVLQDQGYLCAIAGLALDSGRGDAATLRRALDLCPLSQIVVRVVVSPAVAEARLRQRLAGMGSAARRLERPPADNRRLEKLFDQLDAELFGRGRPALHVAGSDPDSLAAAVDTIVAAVLAGAGAIAGAVE